MILESYIILLNNVILSSPKKGQRIQAIKLKRKIGVKKLTCGAGSLEISVSCMVIRKEKSELKLLSKKKKKIQVTLIPILKGKRRDI